MMLRCVCVCPTMFGIYADRSSVWVICLVLLSRAERAQGKVWVICRSLQLPPRARPKNLTTTNISLTRLVITIVALNLAALAAQLALKLALNPAGPARKQSRSIINEVPCCRPKCVPQCPAPCAKLLNTTTSISGPTSHETMPNAASASLSPTTLTSDAVARTSCLPDKAWSVAVHVGEARSDFWCESVFTKGLRDVRSQFPSTCPHAPARAYHDWRTCRE